MKNLLKKYQVPLSGWDYWYISDDNVWGYDEDMDEFIIIESNNNEYMNNLINNLPQRESMGHGPEGRRKYNRWDEHLRRAAAIIESGNGIDIAALTAKVREAMRWTKRYRERLSEFMNMHLVTYEMDGGKMYLKDMSGKYIEGSRLYWRRKIIYVDEQGIVRRYPTKPRGRKRPDMRTHYQKITWSRMSYKQDRKDEDRIAHFYLKMINNRDLQHYYEEVLKTYRKLNEMEIASQKDRPTKKKEGKDYWHQWELWKWREDKASFTLAKKKERDRIRETLDDMMKGDFSSYYNSKEYLYTLYKECRHFDNF